MTALVSVSELSKSYSGRALFEGISLSVGPQERVTIIGANGSGKSTLLRIVAGLDDPDSGECVCKKGLALGYVSQTPRLDADATVRHTIDEALLGCRDRFATEDETALAVRAERIISQVGFADGEQRVGTLSGGWQKRVAIACALIGEPELLMLDEPTNHLDLEGILWLERLLAESRFAFVVVTHDRAFLQAVSRRVIELDRRYPGGFLSVAGAYSDFLEKRELALAAEARRESSLASKVRRDIDWLRQSPKARTSKSKGHIDRATSLIEELAELKARNPAERGAIEFTSSGRKSKRLVVGVDLAKSMGGRQLFSGLDLLLRPKLRLGLVGENGSGKTTLLRLLGEEIAPDEGRLRRLHDLEVVYFDQRREQLDPDQSLRRALSPKGDRVIYRDRELHVISWAKRFLFRADQLDMRVGRLSGGEQAKVLIARLMLRRADVLLLDEPTNDLDIPTLEILEEGLVDFPGAVVLVTHDRYMLDRVCTVLLGLDGTGGAAFYGDYAQWQQAADARREPAGPRKRVAAARPAKPRGPKMSYLEKRELEGMETAIVEAERALEEARRREADPSIASDAAELQARFEARQAAQARVDELYARWQVLEAKREAEENA